MVYLYLSVLFKTTVFDLYLRATLQVDGGFVVSQLQQNTKKCFFSSLSEIKVPID